MSTTNTVNLSQLPAPQVVEPLSFETILAEMLADLAISAPDFSAPLESDPTYKILEVAAYRELLLRQRVNSAARAIMLAYASGSDLDQIGANAGVQRLLVDTGNPDAIPPVLPTYEPDDDFRQRIQLAPDAITTAGSRGSYIFHGRSASGLVKDIQPLSPVPGEVHIYVLARTGDGTAPPELLATVLAALSADNVRPLSDAVTTHSATIVPFAVDAVLTMYPGPDAEIVRQTAVAAVTNYADNVRRFGYDVTLSGLYAALHQPGVQSVNLISPAATVAIADGQAPYCTAITVSATGGTNV